MSEYFVGWWNLENLFDVVGSVHRPDWMEKTLKSELKGWDQSVLNKKISQLAKIIKLMNQGNGPDILGVCEIENRPVVEALIAAVNIPGRSYKVAHHDMNDKRGIDVAFIYDEAKFTAGEQFDYVVLKREATLDIFQVNFTTKPGGKPFVLIGNHWPARSAGQYESEPYRIIAAETLSYWNERILDILGKDTAIFIMGDFNDEPFNRSVSEYALSGSGKEKVENATSPRMLNLMWSELGRGLGSYYYNNFPNLLDQFWVSKGVVTGKSGFRVKTDANGDYLVAIEMFEEMKTPNSDYPTPVRFGRPSGSFNENGYSDHYPISMVIEEV